MKYIVSVTFVLLVLFNNCFPQSGWFNQYSNTTNHLRDVHFVNSRLGWAVGWYNTICKTTNGGLSWFPQYSPSVQNSFQSCYFVNELTGWICGGSTISNTSYIYKTTNGGNNWFIQYSSSSGVLTGVYFSGISNGGAVGYGGKILVTSDGGDNWIAKSSGTSVNLTNIFFKDSINGWVVGDSGIIIKTTNGGAVWSPYYSGTNQNLEGLYFLSSQTVFISGYNGVVLKTIDNGINWITKYSGSSNWLNSVCFLNDNTGWIAGGNYPNLGVILKTTNGGENWIGQTIPYVPWIANIYFKSSDTGWAVGNDGTVISTVTGGLPIPLAPTLIFPSNNLINVPINTTFRWSNVAGAEQYSIHISTVPHFAVIVDTATVDTNFYNIPEGKLVNNLTYFWHVKASNHLGTSLWSATFMFSSFTTGIYTISTSIPKDFKLYDAYPNPFNPFTKIKFDLPINSSVQLRIYDLSGKLIETLYDGNIISGSHEYNWNADKFNSGVYIFQLISKEYNSSKKLVLIK